MHIPVWFFLLLLLTAALPVTTPGLIGFGVGWVVARRRVRAGGARAFKWCTLVLAPFWLAGAAFGGWWISVNMADDAKRARMHYQVKEATVIDGVDIPAGAWVSRDGDNGPLRGVEPPKGTTLALDGATWRGEVRFASSFNGPRRQISYAFLAADAVIDGIPCRGEERVDFTSNDRAAEELWSCTLSREQTVDATIEDPTGASRVQSFACRAGMEIEMQTDRRRELGKCTLAAPATFGGVTCAEGAELKMVTARLNACTLAKQARFGPIDLPAGSFVNYVAAKPSWFRLSPTGPALDGFGLSLPPGTYVKFCFHAEKLESLTVDRAAYVTVAELKLTGEIEFDCDQSQSSPFRSGTLFDDSIVGGKQRQRGEVVSQEDLSPK